MIVIIDNKIWIIKRKMSNLNLTAKQREKEFLLNLEENKKSTKDLDIPGY